MDFFWPVLAIVYQGWTLTLPGVVIFALAVGLPRRRSEDLYSSRQLALAALLVFPITISGMKIAIHLHLDGRRSYCQIFGLLMSSLRFIWL